MFSQYWAGECGYNDQRAVCQSNPILTQAPFTITQPQVCDLVYYNVIQ